MNNNDQRQKQIAIVGGGLAGALMAALLGHDGHSVDVYERRADPRDQGFIGGRSINLALSTRGLHALDQAGLKSAMLDIAVPMKGRMIHSPTGQLTFQPYGLSDADAINSVSRGDLNIALLKAAAAYESVRLHFQHRCIDLDPDTPTLEFIDDATGASKTVTPDLVIGADGAFSAVRARMQRFDRFDYSQSYLSHGYKELHVPAGPNGAFAMEKNALHIWPRGGFMTIALPNIDGSFTVTCFWPFSGPNSFENLTTDAQIMDYFRAVFPDAVPLMPTLVEDFKANPTSSLVTVKCGPWMHRDKVVLIGDAAHAVVPFYGQGINAGFEDCIVLRDKIREFAPNWERALAEYYASRKPNTDALADLCVDNFYEMRDHVASRMFRLQKRFEKFLAKLFPRWFIPMYSMITFSRIPYAQAKRRDLKQQAALRTLGRLALVALVVGLATAAAIIFRG